MLHASPQMVEAWEQGKREPEGMELALLDAAEGHPEVLLDRVKKIARANEDLAPNA